MLGPALRMALACAAAIMGGLLIRFLLPQFLLRMDLDVILLRSGMLCLVGLGIYFVIARLLKINELSEIQRLINRKLNHRALSATQADLS
jgi:peptidoglycan biosynthesis protein MviN/MurJ (putative lipid II flippase)